MLGCLLFFFFFFKQKTAYEIRLSLVGSEHSVQTLMRVTRLAEDEFRTDNLGAVRFVPLLGEQGWS